jgi:hypothetical protein
MQYLFIIVNYSLCLLQNAKVVTKCYFHITLLLHIISLQVLLRKWNVEWHLQILYGTGLLGVQCISSRDKNPKQQ